MSHFGVLVVGNVEEQLAPFHEFECTGINDQYVIDIDITDEVKNGYIEYQGDYQNIFEYCDGWYGIRKKLQVGEKPDINGKHKWAYIVVDSNGELVKVIKRTNPNKKWDWYQLGGRFSGYLQHKNGNRVNTIRKGDWAIDEIIKKGTDKANVEFDRFEEVTKGLPLARAWEDILNDISFKDREKQREFYHNQPMKKAWAEANMGLWNDGFEDFLKGRKHYVESRAIFGVIPYAYVRDQKWETVGDIRWFGVSMNEVADEIAWCKAILEEIKSLPDDTIISLVDCHI